MEPEGLPVAHLADCAMQHGQDLRVAQDGMRAEMKSGIDLDAAQMLDPAYLYLVFLLQHLEKVVEICNGSIHVKRHILQVDASHQAGNDQLEVVLAQRISPGIIPFKRILRPRVLNVSESSFWFNFTIAEPDAAARRPFPGFAPRSAMIGAVWGRSLAIS